MIPQDAGSTPVVQCFHAAELGECLWFFEQFQHSSTPKTKKFVAITTTNKNHTKSLTGWEP